MKESIVFIFITITCLTALKGQDCDFISIKSPDYEEELLFDDPIFKSAKILYFDSGGKYNLKAFLKTRISELECYKQVGIISQDGYELSPVTIRTKNDNIIKFMHADTRPNAQGEYLFCSVEYLTFSDSDSFIISEIKGSQIIAEQKARIGFDIPLGYYNIEVKNTRSNRAFSSFKERVYKPWKPKESDLELPALAKVKVDIQKEKNGSSAHQESEIRTEQYLETKPSKDFNNSEDGIIGRRVIYREISSLLKSVKESGKVVATICINRAGIPVYSEINEEKTTITNPQTLKKFLKAIQGYRYEKDPNAEKEQCGTLSFTLDFDLAQKDELRREAAKDIKSVQRGTMELKEFQTKYNGLTPNQLKNLSVEEFKKLLKK
jgi:hypothetical protein